MLDKLTGTWAPKPSSGPHKARECLPLIVMMRNRLKYALTFKEAKDIMIQRLIKVDNKVRTDHTFPAGFQDVVTIDKTKENFRILLDTKGRFVVHKVTPAEATYKLCRVQEVCKGPKGVGVVRTHDGRTVRFPHPDIKRHDTIRLDLQTGKILDHAKYEQGNVCMLLGGNNMGRVGVITKKEKHPGSFEIVHLVDKEGHHFATRLQNVMVIGQGNKPWISLPKRDGVKLNIIQDRQVRMGLNK
jgi:small subunit ribosomal protein S4e